MITAYYNEIEPYPARWMRNLIDAGHIAPGTVDERSILEVKPDELTRYTQCHFFAGIAGWSYALRLAGWPDDRPVWTGSCPCQPFSAAGKRGGTDDPRHLWPVWFSLIRECRPPVVFGEQVASKDGLAWLDIVCADLEGAGYAVAPFDLSAAGAGAPHIRQRLYFVANANGQRYKEPEPASKESGNIGDRQFVSSGDFVHPLAYAAGERRGEAGRDCGRSTKWIAGDGDTSSMAHATGGQLQIAERRPEGRNGNGAACGLAYAEDPIGRAEYDINGEAYRRDGSGRSGNAGNLGDTGGKGLAGWQSQPGNDGEQQQAAERTGSAWSGIEWLPCRDGKYRPTQPGIFPLAARLPGRVGRLRAYGNAIVPPLAAEFIRAYKEQK
jgi:DNA (cytosine-5)-methyltransferase 1